jgi:hypothetical protein
MASDDSPDQMAKKVFVVTMIGTVLYVGTVFIFILWPSA